MHAGFDGSMHYDVGDALLQLGLPDEALRSYRLAAEDPTLTCAASLAIARIVSAPPTPPPTGRVAAGSLDDDLDAAFDLTFG